MLLSSNPNDIPNVIPIHVPIAQLSMAVPKVIIHITVMAIANILFLFTALLLLHIIHDHNLSPKSKTDPNHTDLDLFYTDMKELDAPAKGFYKIKDSAHSPLWENAGDSMEIIKNIREMTEKGR